MRKRWLKHLLVWLPSTTLLIIWSFTFLPQDHNKFPREIFTGQKISTLEKEFTLNENLPRDRQLKEKVLIYRFGMNGKVDQEIHGQRSWNCALFYDWDADGIPEFLVAQESGSMPFLGVQEPSIFKLVNGKFEFMSSVSRSELRAKDILLDIKFYPSPYLNALLVLMLCAICFGLCAEILFFGVYKKIFTSILGRAAFAGSLFVLWYVGEYVFMGITGYEDHYLAIAFTVGSFLSGISWIFTNEICAFLVFPILFFVVGATLEAVFDFSVLKIIKLKNSPSSTSFKSNQRPWF